jgi:cryptochrome
MAEPEGYQSAEDSAAGEQDNYFTDEESVSASDNDYTSDGGAGTAGMEGSGSPDNSLVMHSAEGTNTKDASVAHPPTSLHWVRMSALRIHDNPALHHSIQDSHRRFRAVFMLDPWFVRGRIGVNRCRFLLECLHDMDKRLRSYNSRLYVVQGQPIAVLEELFHRWNVRQLTYQQDMDPHSQAIEEGIDRVAESCGVKVQKFASHTLYDLSTILAANDNQPVILQKVFREVISKLDPASPPLHDPEVAVSQLLISEEDTDFAQHRIPTMQDLGFECSSLYTNVWVGGETEALRRLPLYCQMRCQDTENNVDMLFDKSALSPYVRFGCLSVRYLLWKAKWLAKSNPAVEKVVKQLSQKLLDREFYFVVAAQIPNYDSIENNPICLQLPWEHDPALLSRWREGHTGYPWIDAAMRQLNKEGWIHNCLR